MCIRDRFRRTWQSPSNAHTYRLYVFKEPLLNLTFVRPFWLLHCDQRSLELYTAFQASVNLFVFGNLQKIDWLPKYIAANSEKSAAPRLIRILVRFISEAFDYGMVYLAFAVSYTHLRAHETR